MTLRVAVLDYDAGNVHSAAGGFRDAGADAVITSAPDVAAAADALVVPGVGHIQSCLANLAASGLRPVLESFIAESRPVFGICVGMQLLYGHSDEGDTDGLGLLPGRVVRFRPPATVPHMGWDVVTATDVGRDDGLLDGVDGERCYFVHGYYAVPDDPRHVLADCDYGDGPFPCLVRQGSVTGTQFHPEKSGAVGRRLLANWVRAQS